MQGLEHFENKYRFICEHIIDNWTTPTREEKTLTRTHKYNYIAGGKVSNHSHSYSHLQPSYKTLQISHSAFLVISWYFLNTTLILSWYIQDSALANSPSFKREYLQ